MTDYRKIHEEYAKDIDKKMSGKLADALKYFNSTKEVDMVNNPPHYNHKGIECIEAIKAALTPEEFRGYIKGNIFKYTWREQYKNKDEDLKKAQWYLNELIKELDKCSKQS